MTDLLFPKSHPQRGPGHRCCADLGFQVSCQNVADRRSSPRVVLFDSHFHAPRAFPCVLCVLLGLNGTSVHELHFRASQGLLQSSCAHRTARKFAPAAMPMPCCQCHQVVLKDDVIWETIHCLDPHAPALLHKGYLWEHAVWLAYCGQCWNITEQVRRFLNTRSRSSE